jgi:hypothetical protein
MNKNKLKENMLKLSLIICLSIVMFSCIDTDFDKDYTLIDAGLGVNTSLTFDANAGTQEVTFPTVPEGSVWGYRKSADWISVAQYNNKLVISVPLFEGLVEDELSDRNGTVTLVKEAADGLSVEAGKIEIKQTYAVPGTTNWDNNATTYQWEWNSKDSQPVAFAANDTKWNETALDGDGKPYYKYVYKIIGKGASSFEQTVNDTVRPSRTIKLANKEENKGKEKEVIAYFIVTDKDGTTIHLRRELKVDFRKGDFILNPDEVVVSADKHETEIEIISLNAEADIIECTIKSNGDWITVPTDILKGGDKFKIEIAANEENTEGRETQIELVKKSGESFVPPVYLTVKQNQKLYY